MPFIAWLHPPPNTPPLAQGRSPCAHLAVLGPRDAINAAAPLEEGGKERGRWQEQGGRANREIGTVGGGSIFGSGNFVGSFFVSIFRSFFSPRFSIAVNGRRIFFSTTRMIFFSVLFFPGAAHSITLRTAFSGVIPASGSEFLRCVFSAVVAGGSLSILDWEEESNEPRRGMLVCGRSGFGFHREGIRSTTPYALMPLNRDSRERVSAGRCSLEAGVGGL